MFNSLKKRIVKLVRKDIDKYTIMHIHVDDWENGEQICNRKMQFGKILVEFSVVFLNQESLEDCLDR